MQGSTHSPFFFGHLSHRSSSNTPPPPGGLCPAPKKPSLYTAYARKFQTSRQPQTQPYPPAAKNTPRWWHHYLGSGTRIQHYYSFFFLSPVFLMVKKDLEKELSQGCLPPAVPHTTRMGTIDQECVRSSKRAQGFPNSELTDATTQSPEWTCLGLGSGGQNLAATCTDGKEMCLKRVFGNIKTLCLMPPRTER